MKPNIVFILCDDLGWMDLTCYGSSFYETPQLDRLAKKGIRFTEAYASCPVCSPTRASVMTGKYPATVGITQYIGGHNVGALCDVPYFDRLPSSEHTLPTVLKEEGGYQTWHVGKWHLGPQGSWPQNRGFEVNIGGWTEGHPKKGYFSPYGFPTLEEGPEGEYLTDRLNQEAIDLIKNRDTDRPFFLNYWPYAVHTPIEAPADLIAKYEAKAKAMGIDHIDPIERGEGMSTLAHRGSPLQRRKLQSHPGYAAMMENLDSNLGELFDTLDAEGLSDNTLIVFTSDNGGLATREGSPTCNAPLAEGKGWMYEGGTREPLIAVWPGVIPEGIETDTVTTTPDFYPTFLEVAGLAPHPEQHVDGMNILPAFKGEPFERGAVFWHYPHYSNQGGCPGSSVREGDWKLIEFFEGNRLELYNLKTDISESHNLAESEPEICAKLHTHLKQWRESVCALIPQKNVNWRDA
ncbi:sulfatase [Kiritimatiellota bacterium B12222]|nr:sulfatase [Kiritimatiellota bacterium B12222]